MENGRKFTWDLTIRLRKKKTRKFTSICSKRKASGQWKRHWTNFLEQFFGDSTMRENLANGKMRPGTDSPSLNENLKILGINKHKSSEL